MKVSFKKSSSIVLLLNYIGRLLSAVNAFFLLPAFLSLEELGLFAGIHHMVFLLARFDLGQGIIRYGAKLRDNERGKAAFLGWMWVASTFFYFLVIAIFFACKSFLVTHFAPKAPDVIHYLPLILTLGYIVLMNVTLKAWYIALDRVLWPSVFQHVILNLLLIVLVICYGWGLLSFEQLLFATALPYIGNLGLLLGDLWRRGELFVCWDSQFFNKSFTHAFVLYTFFTLLASSMAMLMIRIDNIMVFGMCGKKAEGIYHTVAFMALLLEIPMKVVKQTSASHVVRLLEQQERKPLNDLYKHVTHWQFVLTSLCFVLLYTYIDCILYAFPADTVAVMKQLFLLLGIAKLIDNLFRMGSEILLLSRYFMWSIVSGGLVLLGTFANYRLILSMGMYGASLATGMTLLIGGSISSGLIWHRLGIHPWSWSLLCWIGITLVVLGTLVIVPPLPNVWLDILMRTIFILAVYGGGYWYRPIE